jgi:hypothetical protein
MPLHPLDATDRPIIEALGRVDEPSDLDVINAARLVSRYCPKQCSDPLDPTVVPPSPDLFPQLAGACKRWGLSRSELQARARAIWASAPDGRPVCLGEEADRATLETVGSGADVQS